jgi:hypothetical protein
MCKNFTETIGLGQYTLGSKADILFYSACNLLPACGVQSVQRTEGNITTKPNLKSSGPTEGPTDIKGEVHICLLQP